MLASTETGHALTRTQIAARYLRWARTTLFAILLVALLLVSPPLWAAGIAIVGAIALDAGFWWFRRRVKGLLSPELANAALDLVPAIFFVLDSTGCIQYWNLPFSDWSGHDADDLHGQQLYRFFDGDPPEHVVVAVTRALTRGVSTVEAEFTNTEGVSIPMLLTLLRVNLGGTYRLIGVGQDIRARKEAEAKLRRQEKRYRLLAENVTDVVTHLDPATNVKFVSQSVTELLGYEADELVGRRALDLVHPEDRDWCMRVITEALSEGRRPRPEFRLRTKEDGYIWVEAVGKEIDPPGSRPELVLTARDISKRKARETELTIVEAARQEAEQARAEAERANRLKSAFLANMSHEIRTPLTSILGFAQAIGERVEVLEVASKNGDVRALDRFAELIEESGERLLGTLDGVLNLSKLEAGEMNLTPQPIDLAQEPKEVTALFEPQARAAGIELEAEIEDAPVPAAVDPHGLHIVLQNLISNALKYTDEDGKVTVRVRVEDDVAVLEVQDTGIGMHPENVPDLFEPFRQESEGLDRTYEGTGLGLAVARRAVEEMHGTIDVETEKGTGSRFIIRLPMPNPEDQIVKA